MTLEQYYNYSTIAYSALALIVRIVSLCLRHTSYTMLEISKKEP